MPAHRTRIKDLLSAETSGDITAMSVPCGFSDGLPVGLPLSTRTLRREGC